MKFKFVVVKNDFRIGIFFNNQNRCLYIHIFPMLKFIFDFTKKPILVKSKPNKSKGENKSKKSSKPVKRSTRIKKLFSLQEGKCYSCKEETILRLTKDKEGKLLDNVATIEHLFHKFDIRRSVAIEGEWIVMGCSKCNQEKGKEFMDSFYKDYHSSEKEYDNLLINILKKGG